MFQGRQRSGHNATAQWQNPLTLTGAGEVVGVDVGYRFLIKLRSP